MARHPRRALQAAPLVLAITRPGRAAAERHAPITLLIPAPPGGANWLLAGLLAEQMGQILDRPVTLRARPSPRGAGHGIEALLHMPNDGT